MSVNRMHQKAARGRYASMLAFLAIAGLWAGPAIAVGTDRTSASAAQIDTSKNGVYQSGLWRYECSVSSPGSKSEGYHGTLLYNGEVLAEPPRVNDYYQTPWGPMYWVGQPVVLWGSHGWMPSSLGREPAGQALPIPSTEGKLIVCVEVLTPEPLGTPDRLEKSDWVLAGLKGFGAKEGHVQWDWLRLGKVLVVGPEANGKTVAVKDVDTLVTTEDRPRALCAVPGGCLVASGGNIVKITDPVQATNEAEPHAAAVLLVAVEDDVTSVAVDPRRSYVYFATQDATCVWAEGKILPVFPAGSRLLWVDDTLTICQPSVGQVVQISSVSGHVQKLLAGG